MPDVTPWQAATRPVLARQAVVVLGMHRSGTSALAGVLAKLGAAPPRTLMRADQENPTGYWESDVIYRIHTRLLIALHSEWDSIAPLPPEWWLSDTAVRFADELVEAVHAEFGEASLFVLKDPRICRLVPLWTQVLARVGAQPGYVLLTRNPLEVAASLQARDGFPCERSLLLWLRHLLEAELATRDARRTFLSFSALLEDWSAAVRKIAADLSIVWPSSAAATNAAITEFVTGHVRHHRIPDEVVLESAAVPSWIRRGYRAALAAANESQGNADGAPWDELRAQLADVDRLMGPLLGATHAGAQPLIAELETARRELRRTETEREAAHARIAEYEREQATFGAQVGRWLTRRRATWAPVGSLRGRLVSVVVGRARAAFRDTPAIGWAPVDRRGDDAGGRAVSSLSRAPASERLCDVVIVAFALWTICAHLVVIAGGGLLVLISLYAGTAVAAIALRRRWRPAPIAAWPGGAGPSGRPCPALWAGRWLPGGVALLGFVVTLSFAHAPDGLRLWWSAIALLGAFAVAVFLRDEPRVELPVPSRSAERGLWALAVACVVLTLAAHRPDPDDAFYVNVAVAAAEARHHALFSGDTLHGIDGISILPVYRVHSYELWNGALAYLTGIPAIYVFHWISAAFAALLVPLAYAKLFRLLTPRWWLWSVGVVILVFVVVGETHRWYGNFAFVRMWQGKAVFLSVALPMIYAYGLRFGMQPTTRDWILLGAAQVAAVGLTSTALWAAPASALLAIATTLRPLRQSLTIAAIGLLGSVYVLGQAWLVRAGLADLRAMWATSAGGESGAHLLGAFITTLGDSRVLLFGIGTLLVAGAVASSGLARRFAVIGPLVLLFTVLNPYVATWATSNLTGPSYWRGMWALPMPILMTLVLTSPLRLQPARPLLGRILCLGFVTAFALVIPRYSAISATNGVHVGWPTLKVPAASYRWAALVNQSVPPGTQVAVPSTIDPWIGTFERHAHPIMVRHYLWVRPTLTPEELHRRSWLRDALGAPEMVEGAPRVFFDALDRFQVGAVCLAVSGRADTARAVLQEAGFRRTVRDDAYELWVRPSVGVSSVGTATWHARPADADPVSPASRTSAGARE